MKSLRILGLTAFLFLPSFVSALTLSEIRTEARRHVRDTGSVQQRYSDTMLTSLANEAQRQMVNSTWCIEKTSGIALSVRTTYYSFPTDFIAVREFDFQETTSGRTRQLEEKSERVIRQENPDYARQAGAPNYYFTRQSTFGVVSIEFGINPIPSTSTQLGTAVIKYYGIADDMSSDSSVPFEGLSHLYAYHHALVHYIVAQLKLYEGDSNGSGVYMQFFSAEVQNMANRLGERPNYFPSFGAVGGSTSRGGP